MKSKKSKYSLSLSLSHCLDKLLRNNQNLSEKELTKREREHKTNLSFIIKW
jgi:hypothetical protein